MAKIVLRERGFDLHMYKGTKKGTLVDPVNRIYNISFTSKVTLRRVKKWINNPKITSYRWMREE